MWGQMILAMPGDGKWLGASHNEAVYKTRTVRVMYHDAGGIAVCYIRSAFLKGSPVKWRPCVLWICPSRNRIR